MVNKQTAGRNSEVGNFIINIEGYLSDSTIANDNTLYGLHGRVTLVMVGRKCKDAKSATEKRYLRIWVPFSQTKQTQIFANRRTFLKLLSVPSIQHTISSILNAIPSNYLLIMHLIMIKIAIV
jgi:hypothetical protein